LGIVSSHAPNLANKGLRTVDESGQPIPASETTSQVVRDVLRKLPNKTVPLVIEGTAGPIPEHLGQKPGQGARFILDEARTYSAENRLTVVCLGPATDLALALLYAPMSDCQFQNHIQVVAFGFNKWPDGTDRFNVKNDIHAWQILMKSEVPLTVASCDVAVQDLYLDRNRGENLLEGHGDIGPYLLRLLNTDRNPELAKKVTGRDQWPIYDEEVVAYLLGLAKVERHHRPTLRDDTSFDTSKPAESKAPFNWITSVDSDKLWNDLESKLPQR
jgi:inosine-uridine nucleoside N-ribohydrolase